MNVDYKQAFNELVGVFSSVKDEGQLAPIRDYANSLAKQAEENEGMEEANRLEAAKQAKIETEPDEFKKISMKYMTAEEIAMQEEKKDPFQAAADKYK